MPYGDPLRSRLTRERVLEKVRWEVLQATAPVARRFARNRGRTFPFRGKQYEYFVHSHNLTWRNERAVELPIALRFLEDSNGRVLEFGNVLGRYGANVARVILDKYERGPGVINQDIVDYFPENGFDRIVSVSTLEHVGWDESPQEPQKVFLAWDRLRGLLNPQGSMLITVPLGQNPLLDEAIYENSFDVTRASVMIRSGDDWLESTDFRVQPQRPNWALGPDRVWIAEVLNGE